MNQSPFLKNALNFFPNKVAANDINTTISAIAAIAKATIIKFAIISISVTITINNVQFTINNVETFQ